MKGVVVGGGERGAGVDTSRESVAPFHSAAASDWIENSSSVFHYRLLQPIDCFVLKWRIRGGVCGGGGRRDGG